MQKQKKILFLHGFYASGSCVPALALKEAFEKRATVLTPDLPLHPADAVRLIREICDQEKPDILVGNSCGSFYAQMISPIIGVPALLGNPHFKMSDFLRERIGNHQYKSPRADGKQDFTINEQLISEFEEMEAHQFDCCNIYNKVRVWGLFGEEDTLAHFEPLFNRSSNDLVWRDVKVDADGEYVLSIDFVSPEDRGFNLSVDGASTRHVDVKGTNGAISTIKVPVKLTAGVHSIRLSNAAGWIT